MTWRMTQQLASMWQGPISRLLLLKFQYIIEGTHLFHPVQMA